ncbi:MAG: hypothetical protein AAFR54_19010, partial [Planctomycetota bacterium]
MPDFLNGLFPKDEKTSPPPVPMSDDAQAFEEIKLLQAIIARQDDFKARTKAAAVTFFAALTALYARGDLGEARTPYALITLSAIVLFAFLETSYGGTMIKAESRVSKIEKRLRKKRSSDRKTSRYEGPRIGRTMGEVITWGNRWRAFKRPRTAWFYVPLFLVTLGAAFAVSPTGERAAVASGQ